MMPLSWNEIKTRASAFVNEWKDKAIAAREEADAQTFEAEFFNIFGISRKQAAIFEHKVLLGGEYGLLEENASGKKGYIDLFCRGHILIEMKTPGKDLEKAYQQARNYALALAPNDLPRGVLICDFINFHYYNLDEEAESRGKLYKFILTELVDHIELFAYIAGYKDVVLKKFDLVNIEAAEKMGKLHDSLKEVGYKGHDLEVYLVRLLFCLFADDTGIFEHDHFIKYIAARTNPDGTDLALHIGMIFEILNKPKEKRLKNIDEQLNLFPYVDGGLFEEHLETASFDSAMREKLIDCCRLDWSKISPAIFGAMFQSILDDSARHDVGAHYTSEENILKVIHPLFLDNLLEEFLKIKKLTSNIRKTRLNEFHDKISSLKFLDPACGCGNFLVISYRELRLLELEVLKELLSMEKLLDVEQYIKVNVNQFYGIEIVEFPAKVAQTAMWLMDHQMNIQVREQFGQYYVRIPLTNSASIHNANALPLDWETVVPKNELNYILGNPPFLGARIMSKEQKSNLELVLKDIKNCNNLDYVTCWYIKAAQYISNAAKDGKFIYVDFVSTNSICQGEQVPILWPQLINKYGIKINFAHQTFKWSNEAKGKAAVYCVIIGFSLEERKSKKLYLYSEVSSEPTETTASNINAYLIDAPDLFIRAVGFNTPPLCGVTEGIKPEVQLSGRTKIPRRSAAGIFIEKKNTPICKVSEMLFGSMPNDGGNFLLDENEKNELLKKDATVISLIRPILGSREFLHNILRYCIWLDGVPPSKYQNNKTIMDRILKVKELRLNSKREATKKLAEFPMLFGEIRQPKSNYLLVPSTSSERRKYIPIGFIDMNFICSDANLMIPNATLYEFGIITSTMHMAWVRYVCGRLKSDYRYSASIVYNNFPWPSPTDKQKEIIKSAAQNVLDARKLHTEDALGALYNPLTMPPDLTKAHNKLDRLVEKAYGRTFDNDTQRVAYLFELYQTMTSELFVETKKTGKGRKL
ncbi:MAG: N-6 DNA methylase [Termitinemataceae bacterium]|nr:MAG: N-6 DNA methylase [Termitinemataceae bacterium]